MKKNKFLAVCGILAGAGVLFYAIGFGLGGGVTGIGLGSDGLQVHTLKGMENERHYNEGKETLEDFHSMNINIDYAEFKIEISDHYGIKYRVNSDYDFTFEVKDGCLEVLEGMPERGRQFAFINLGFYRWNPVYEKEYVTVYVPKDADLEAMSVSNDSGNITLVGLNAREITVEADEGHVDIREIEASNVNITLDSGNLTLKNINTEILKVTDEYGNCDLTDVSVKTLAKIKLDSGNFSMRNTQIKELDVAMEYGNMEAKELKAEKITAVLDSGNIRMEQAEVHTLKAEAEYGNITGKELKLEEMNLILESGNCVLSGLTIKKADIAAEYGNVELEITDSTAAYGMELHTDDGEITIDHGKSGESYTRNEGKEAGRYMKINCDSGNIQITGK